MRAVGESSPPFFDSEATMRSLLACSILAVGLAWAQHSIAAEGPPKSAFDRFLTADGPGCVKLDVIAKVGKVIDLSRDQFQFVRALYVAIPPVSKTIPPGDRAVISGAADGTAMVSIVDGKQVCARFLAPDFVLQMLNDIAAKKVTHAGDPT